MEHVNVTASQLGWNHATQSGGVLHWTMTDHPTLTTHSPFHFLTNCTLYNNTATYNGPVIATGPTRLYITTNLGQITDTITPFALTVASAQQVWHRACGALCCCPMLTLCARVASRPDPSAHPRHCG